MSSNSVGNELADPNILDENSEIDRTNEFVQQIITQTKTQEELMQRTNYAVDHYLNRINRKRFSNCWKKTEGELSCPRYEKTIEQSDVVVGSVYISLTDCKLEPSLSEVCQETPF